jgi:hypothetical protein
VAAQTHATVATAIAAQIQAPREKLSRRAMTIGRAIAPAATAFRPGSRKTI